MKKMILLATSIVGLTGCGNTFNFADVVNPQQPLNYIKESTGDPNQQTNGPQQVKNSQNPVIITQPNQNSLNDADQTATGEDNLGTWSKDAPSLSGDTDWNKPAFSK